MVISDLDLPDGFTEMILPEMTWAIFDCVGMIPHSIQNGWKDINEEWFSDGNSYDNNYLSQIWIPIIEED